MNTRMTMIVLFLLLGVTTLSLWLRPHLSNSTLTPRDPHQSTHHKNHEEVLFWHFWGGPDKDVVESVVQRFNQSQNSYFVRAVAMPGNNLQAKLFLSVAGGDPPDLVNQDDPVLADWARRGVIAAIDEIADPSEVATVGDWMLDSARRLSVVDERMFAVCNGLDVRALFYNKTALDERGFAAPKTIEQLDSIATAFTSEIESNGWRRFGYLPDSRRIWAWGYVFGGDFFRASDIQGVAGKVEINTPSVNSALNWMVSYPARYGADNVAAFRAGDQSLPGKTFPLLPILDDQVIGRYVMVMDGQWRVRDIEEFSRRRREHGFTVPEFGVSPLPIPAEVGPNGAEPRENGGWVNGNFFVVPRGAKNPTGAWEFMKFWIGYADPDQAATTCADGGWIPVSQNVIKHPRFQRFLDETPLFRPFVELAASPNQFPIPQVPGAAMFQRAVEDAAFEAMSDPNQPVHQILAETEQRIQAHLNRAQRATPKLSRRSDQRGDHDEP